MVAEILQKQHACSSLKLTPQYYAQKAVFVRSRNNGFGAIMRQGR